MNPAAEITRGSHVRLHYTITLEDGTEADSSRGGEPLDFVLGDGTMLEGLEDFLLGMRAGQRAAYSVSPEQGFGYRDAEAVHVMPRSDFPAEMELAPGVIVAFTTPAGDEVPGTVTALDETQVTVDFNHPLAGHTLNFDVEILAVQA
ncbi:FKBP-type peptidyl-prolyl cis-trans isomerase [Sulfurivermis fontis]|uniref:FKBP-type peptidyl-prolyl cis-trans isomerase n=1 Tax=Sulfurivermis fontis TaxID=1972068 RepID=UPI000FDA322A|nr:peptidylprolyl isomerase [Sulfurivermis fontis]